MTRAELELLPPGSPLQVRLDGRELPALYHSCFVEGRGRSAQTYVRVLVGKNRTLMRVSIRRIVGKRPIWV